MASALVAFAVEFRTSPKSPPAGLAPPTLDFKSGETRRHHETKLITSAERNSNLSVANWASHDYVRVDLRADVPLGVA